MRPPGGRRLTRAPLGSPAERAPLGGKFYPPPRISRTMRRSGTREAANESSQQNDPNQDLKFS